MTSVHTSGRIYQRLLGALCLVLAVTSFMYWSKGLVYLAIKPATPNDLHLRWVEERYIFAGLNPYDTYFATEQGAATRRPMWNKRPTSVLPGVGVPEGIDYPPWAFFAGAIFLWPGWPAARLYYAVINILAGGLIFAWAFRAGRPHGKLAGLALGLAFTACSANATTLGLGQYGIVITALLVGGLWLIEGRQHASPGVLIGLALTKPTITGPFCLPMLFRRQWKMMAGLAIYLIVADGVIWAVTKTNPVEMLLQMLHAGQAYMSDAYGPMNVLLRMGVPVARAITMTAVGVGGIGAVLIWLWCEAPMLVQFAIASVAGRLWAYHKLYDNIMVAFLLVALGELALRSRRPGHFALFILVGLTLWAPGKACDRFFFQVFQMLVWVFSLAALLAATPRRAMQTTA